MPSSSCTEPPFFCFFCTMSPPVIDLLCGNEVSQGPADTSTVSQDTLDECPMAYKDPQTIISAIGDTVRIEKQIRPIYNFKSSDRFTSKKKK